jgi:hypothetical protein
VEVLDVGDDRGVLGEVRLDVLLVERVRRGAARGPEELETELFRAFDVPDIDADAPAVFPIFSVFAMKDSRDVTSSGDRTIFQPSSRMRTSWDWTICSSRLPSASVSTRIAVWTSNAACAASIVTIRSPGVI